MSHRPASVRRTAALVQHDLIDLENQDDRQLAQAARFLGTLCEARIGLKLPVEMTDDIFQAAVENIQLRATVRSASARLHSKLGQMAGMLGIPEIADGGYPKPRIAPVDDSVAADVVPA